MECIGFSDDIMRNDWEVSLLWTMNNHDWVHWFQWRYIENIGEKEKQGLTFITISRVKSLNGLRVKPPFSYEINEKMEKEVEVTSRKEEEEILRSITLQYICRSYNHYVYSLKWTWTMMIYV